MPIEFTHQESLPADRDRVFDALTDLERASEWMPGYVAIEKQTEGPFGVGTEWRETRKMFGRDATEYFEVTEHERPSRMSVRVDGSRGTSGKGEFIFEYTLVPKGESETEVTLRGEIRRLGPLSGLLGRLMAGPFKKIAAKDLRALGEYLGRGG